MKMNGEVRKIFPLWFRIVYAPFRIAILIVCVIIAVFLEAAYEDERAQRLMKWAML